MSAIIVVLLVLVIARQLNSGSMGDPTVVASILQSPTAISRKPTKIPSKVPSAVPSHPPASESTNVPTPKPTTPPTEEISQNTPSDGAAPTVSLPLPESKSLPGVLSLVQHSDSIFYSTQTAVGWDLTIAIPANGSLFSLQKSAPIDPVPTLSHSGDRLAYLAKGQTGYVVHVLDLRSGSTVSLPLPARIGTPSNLAWQSSDASLLVTSTSVDEPRIYRLDVSSGDIEEFLDPWSANPSVSSNGPMVYVVPFNNDVSNLGIVLANEQGHASLFVTDGSSSVNYPSLSQDGTLVAYTTSKATEQGYSLGIVSRSESGEYLSLPVAASLSSTSPIHTGWIDLDNLVAGLCNDGSCQVVEYPLVGTPRQIILVSDATAIGSVIMRSP